VAENRRFFGKKNKRQRNACPASPGKTMTAQDFILSKLRELKQPINLPTPPPKQLEDEITRLILSNKFRKYSVSDEEKEKIKKAIRERISKNQPVELVFSFGGYKLWRLDEAPEVDWAELFALMYFAKWLKPICEIYAPGAHIDCFSDDCFLPIINNIPENETAKYQQSFNDLILFMENYMPQNLRITFSRVLDQYKNKQEFLTDFEKQKKELASKQTGLTDQRKATIELNVKTTPEQTKDNLWREKVSLDHHALMAVSGRRPYMKMPHKIHFIVGGDGRNGRIATGSTRNSIMKFWVGAGTLRLGDGSYKMTILSPNQLAKTNFDFENIRVDDLVGKNFTKIRIVKQ